MPAVLFIRHQGGRTPSLSTGKFIVPVSEAGARRRKAELKRLRTAAGVSKVWAVSSSEFREAFRGVRSAMVAELQSELKLQLQLLQIAELHAAKDLGADARTSQTKVVAQQARVCGVLFDRLVAWKDGGFFGLSSEAPAGGWTGMWDRNSVLGREKRIPWEGEEASLRDGPADYGCVLIGPSSDRLSPIAPSPALMPPLLGSACCFDVTALRVWIRCRRMCYWLQCRIDRSAEELSLLCDEISATYLQYQKRLAAYTDWLEGAAPVNARIVKWATLASQKALVRTACVPLCPSHRLCCVLLRATTPVCCCASEREPVAFEHHSAG